MLTTFYNHVVEAMSQENKSLKEVAEILNAHGIQGVEIDYRDLNPTGLKLNTNLAFALRDAGLPIYGVYVFYDWARHPFDMSYKRIYRELSTIGVKNSLAVPGMVPEGMDIEKAKSRMLKKLKKAVSFAGQCGIEVFMEDFDDSKAPFSTASGMDYFFKEIPELKCALDTGNFYYSGEDVCEKMPLFKGRIGYVHLKDRSLTPKEGEEPKMTVKGEAMYSSAVGEGIIPFKDIFKRLKDYGYKGDFAIEHFGSKHQLEDMVKSADFITANL